MSKDNFASKALNYVKNKSKILIIMLLATVWLSSCRSHVMPCPSFSHLNKNEPGQLGSGEKLKLDKHGRVKN